MLVTWKELTTTVRWPVILILWFASLSSYVIRLTMSVAVVPMAQELGWSVEDQGSVLSSFFWGYAAGQLPSIIIAERFGGSKLLGLSILLPTICTYMIPVASRTSIGILLAVRALMGLCQSAVFPAIFHLFPRWIPASERTRMVVLVCSGIYLGQVLSYGITGAAVSIPEIWVGGVQIGSWDSAFYITGFFGWLWIPTYFFLYDSPAAHPSISKEEREFVILDSGFVQRTPQVLLPSRGGAEALVPAPTSPASASAPHRASAISSHPESTLEVVVGAEKEGEGDILGADYDTTVTKYHETKKLSTFMEIGDADITMRPRDDSQQLEGSEKEKQGRPRRATFMETGDVEAEVIDSSNWVQRRKESLSQESNGNSASAGRSRTASYTPPMSRIALFAARKSIKKSIDVAEIPWLAMVTNKVSLTLLAVSFAQGWISFIIGTQMPSFLHDQLGYSTATIGFFSIIPYITNYLAVQWFCDLFDWLQIHRNWSLTEVRQWANRFGFLGAAACMVALGHTESREIGLFLLVFTLFWFSATDSGISSSFLDVAPSYSSEINTVANVINCMAGVVAPLVCSTLVGRFGGASGWRVVFFLTAALSVTATGLWAAFFRSEIVPVLNSRVKDARASKYRLGGIGAMLVCRKSKNAERNSKTQEQA